MYGVNAGVPKTLVRHLVRYEADIAATPALKEVLLDILDTPVSPSCCPPRTTARSHSAPRIWWAPMNCTTSTFIMCSASALARQRSSGWPGQPLRAGRNTRTRCFTSGSNSTGGSFCQQFKRSRLPDGPKIGSVTLSPRGDWRMPSDACAALWLAELEQLFPQKDA